MSEDSDKLHDLTISVAKIDERTKSLVDSVKDVKLNLETKYVTQDEFKPIKALMYGLVGVILTSVIGSLILLVLK